jgi:hypothetical protein
MRPKLAFSKLLDVSTGRAWELIIDTWTWPVWGPSVKAVDCLQRFIREKSRGRIQTALGFWLPFRVTVFEPESYWDWRVAGVAATGHRIVPYGNKRCRLSFTVPVWAFGYGPVCRLALMRIDRLLRRNSHDKC